MKLPTISVVAVVAVCIGLASLINEAISEPLSDYLNQISMKSFKVALQNEPDNFIFSPFVISFLFSAIAWGAVGETRSELKTHVPMEDKQIWIYDLPEWNKYTLYMKNKIYINEKIKVRKEYEDFISDLYHLKIEPLNFDNIQNLQNTINNWIQNSHNDCLRERIETDDVANINGLLLMSIIKFKAGWQRGFVNTEKKLFELMNNLKINVPFLTGVRTVFMSKNTDLNATIVKLPYQMPDNQRPVSMFIILPNEIDGLKHIENNIDKINITTLQDLKSNLVKLSIPVFKLETKIDIKEHSKKMGIKNPFTMNANISGINSNHKVYIDKIIQKATISIDADGTGATAASYDDPLESKLGQPEDINVVDVNRPFLVVMVARNSFLFTGRVTNPSL